MIYIDMDGVLCDLVGQVENWHGVKIYNKSNYGKYRIQEACQEIDDNKLFDYFSCYSFWAKMPILPWAHYLVNAVEQIDKEVYIMSRPWLGDGDVPAESCMQGKIAWIANYFPRYLGKLLFVDKKEDFAEGSILIDDNMENCSRFAAKGKTIFIPTPWGDVDYAYRDKTGFELVKEVLGCLNVVESM